MKKILFLIIIALISTNVVFSQKANDKKFRFGLEISPAVGWMKTDNKNYSTSGVNFAYAYGLMTDFNFSSNYAFATGIEVNNNGGLLSYTKDLVYNTDKFNVTSTNYKLRYLNIPLSLKLRTNEIGTITYYGQFGVDLGIKIKALANEDGIADGSTTTSTLTDVNVSKDVEFARLALNIGLGLEMNLVGSTSFIIGINYNNGFTNVLKSNSNLLLSGNVASSTAAANPKLISNFIALKLGILF